MLFNHARIYFILKSDFLFGHNKSSIFLTAESEYLLLFSLHLSWQFTFLHITVGERFFSQELYNLPPWFVPYKLMIIEALH